MGVLVERASDNSYSVHRSPLIGTTIDLLFGKLLHGGHVVVDIANDELTVSAKGREDHSDPADS
jgi:hypothetical protein